MYALFNNMPLQIYKFLTALFFMEVGTIPDASFFEFHKVLFIAAMILVIIISGLIIAAIIKARKDTEKQFDFFEKEIKLLEECRNLLKEIKAISATGAPGETPKVSKPEEAPKVTEEAPKAESTESSSKQEKPE